MLTVENTGGSWHLYQGNVPGSHRNPCLMRDFPVFVEQRADAQIYVRVSASEIIPGCNNSTLSLKLTAPNRMEGNFVLTGAPIVFERK